MNQSNCNYPVTPKSNWKTFCEVVAVVAAVFAILGVNIAAWELVSLNRNLKVDRAIEGIRILLDTDKIVQAKREIARNTSQGTDYRGLIKDPNMRFAVVNFINTLETIAYGVNNGIYDKDYARYNLSEIIYKQVNVYLHGKSGEFSTEEKWLVDEPYFTREEDFPELRKIYARWFPTGKYVNPYR